MKRKVLRVLLTAALAAILAAGCGNSTAETTASEGQESTTSLSESTEPAETNSTEDEQIVLKWAHWDPVQTSAYIDAYESTHPNVKIEFVDFTADNWSTNITTELSGSGTEIDIVSNKDTPSYATLVKKGALMPLDDYIENSDIDLSPVETLMNQVSVDGSTYVVPIDSSFWVVFYNKDIFDRAGVAYPTNDMTFDEFDELARSLTKTDFGAEVYGSHYHTWRSAVQMFGITDGKHTIYDGDYSFFKPFYEMVLNQEDDGVCRKYADVKAEGLAYRAAFAQGNVAMMPMGTWLMVDALTMYHGEWDTELIGNWGMVKYPHAEGVEPGSTIGGSQNVSITAESDNKDAAWDFLQWLYGEEGAKVTISLGNFPANITDEAVDMISAQEGFPEDEQSKDALYVSNLYIEAPYGENVAEINSILDTYHTMIMQRECTIDEGIQKMNEEVAKLSQ